jgi:cell division septum initiation protein DivIVA
MATSDKDLLAQIAELKEKLAEAEIAKTEAQEMASSIAAASSFIGNSEEQPTGNTVLINVCLNPGEKDERKQKFKDVEFPTFYYTIDIPAGAGTNLMTNGLAYYHGQTYEVDQATLVDLKSRVARCWDHEKSIHSENENAYRKPTNTHLISQAAAARGMR